MILRESSFFERKRSTTSCAPVRVPPPCEYKGVSCGVCCVVGHGWPAWSSEASQVCIASVRLWCHATLQRPLMPLTSIATCQPVWRSSRR